MNAQQGTTRCRDCGGVVSVRAAVCPHCGSPNPQPPVVWAEPVPPPARTNTWAIVAVFLGVFAVAFSIVSPWVGAPLAAAALSGSRKAEKDLNAAGIFQKGRPLAKAARILSYVAFAISALGLIWIVVLLIQGS